MRVSSAGRCAIFVLFLLAGVGCSKGNQDQDSNDLLAGGVGGSLPIGTGGSNPAGGMGGSTPPSGGASGAGAGGVGGTGTTPPPAGGGGTGTVSPGGSGGADGAGAGGSDAMADAGTAGDGGEAGSDAAAAGGGGGSVLPPVSDYGAPGPFADAKAFNNVGPNNNYTLFRPDASLGKDGFKHPIVAWGNGIATTPDMYTDTLTLFATHGFVIIAVNDTMVEEPAMSAGLDWLVEQNTADGPLKGMLDTEKEATIGYSWGGGASIDTAHRPNVLCTASLHGMPPRNSDAFDTMHAPLLLFTSTGDSFVTASQFVTPNYDKSTVQTFYATLDDPTAGHLYVADPTAGVCIGAAIGLGDCRGAPDERAPTIAWLRLWLYGDEDAKKFFYGDDCVLCKSPWTMPQRKNWP